MTVQPQQTQSQETDLYEAIMYIINHMAPEGAKEKNGMDNACDESWKVVRREEFLNVLSDALKTADNVPQNINVDDFRDRLKCQQQRFTEYPVVLKHGNKIYSLIPYKKLEEYAQSGRVQFTRYSSCNLLTMWFR